MRKCISHHHACDCREEMMRELCKCFLYPGLKREIEMELEAMRNENTKRKN